MLNIKTFGFISETAGQTKPDMIKWHCVFGFMSSEGRERENENLMLQYMRGMHNGHIYGEIEKGHFWIAIVK